MAVLVAAVDDRFSAFIASDGVSLLRFATLLTGDVAAGEDLLQSVLEKLYPRWASGRPPEDASRYARTAILHAAQRSWRRRRDRPEVLVAEPPETVMVDPETDPLLREALLRALSRLPKRQRAVVVLRYFDGRPETEVASMLGCSIGSVKTHAHRGLRKLRDDPGLTRHFQPVPER